MDGQALQHPQPDLVYPSPERRRSCTTQLDLVKIDPDNGTFNVETAIMSHSPQLLSHSGGGSPQEPQSDVQHRPPQQHSFRPSQEQSQSYPSPEPLPYYGSPPQSQLVGRSQTWGASPAASWPGEAPSKYSFETREPSQDLPLGSYSHGVSAAQTWEQAQAHTYSPRQQQNHMEFSQAHYEARSPLFAPQRYPSIPGDDLPCYSQLGMQTATPHPDDNLSFHGSQFVAQYPHGSYTSAPAQRRPLEVVTSFPSSAYTIPNEAQTSIGLSTPMTPVSDMDEDNLPGCYEEDMRRSGSPVMEATAESTEQGEGGSAKQGDIPYAKLIFQAFMSSPRRALTLQEIYQWFRDNTDKVQPGQNKGWMNSIRHNLSMNGAFERRPVLSDGDGDDGESSPSGTGKKATEWVLCDWAVKKGHVESTTRYRNSARRNGGKKNASRAKTKAARSSPYTTARRRMTPRDVANPYALPSQASYTSMAADQRSRYHAPYATSYDLSAAEQLQRLSIAPTQRYMEHRPYEFHHAAGMSGPLELQVHHGYHPAPLNYSPELFMPSGPGAPTIASEDDLNEVITPGSSYAVLEPTLCGNNSPATAGPTSQPYGQPPSTYYRQHDESGLASYSLGDVAGVCDDNVMRSCWDGEEPSQQ